MTSVSIDLHPSHDWDPIKDIYPRIGHEFWQCKLCWICTCHHLLESLVECPGKTV